jgi:hypothetical protein
MSTEVFFLVVGFLLVIGFIVVAGMIWEVAYGNGYSAGRLFELERRDGGGSK